MSTTGGSLIFLLAYAAVGSAFYPTQPPVHSGFENLLCSVPFGFRPRSCGMYEIVGEVYEPACEYLYGPNVCLFTATVRTNVTEYRYRRGCDWVRVPDYYGGYTYRWQCSHFVCQPTHVCLDETQEFNRSYEGCCPGFAARHPKSIHNPYSRYFHYNFYNPIINDPLGCPVAVADSLLECMEIQGLDEFIKYINMSNYLQLLNTTTDFHLTAFIPTNAALRQAQEMNLIQRPNDTLLFTNLSMMVGNHLVGDNVTIESLRQHGAKIYTTLEGRHLHRVSISFDDRSFVFYPPRPYQLSPTPTIIKPFINGAEVVIENACNTENGTLHIIDRVLIPVESTIADFLESRFPMFAEALDTVGLLSFLRNPNVSRTVFAIPDDAFTEAFPEDLRTCISNYMRLPFNNLLLFHIADEAHYTSSLSLKTFLFTLLNQFMEVEVGDDDVVSLGVCKVPIIEPNIRSLSNGVVHAVERPIFPDNFSFGMCDTFVPSPSPAECPEPLPSPTPTMIDPGVSPIPSTDPDPSSTEFPLDPTPIPTEPQEGTFQ